MTKYEAINQFIPRYSFLDVEDHSLVATSDWIKEKPGIPRGALPRPSWIIHVVDFLYPLSQLPVRQRAAELQGIREDRLIELKEYIEAFAKPGMSHRTTNALRAEVVANAIKEVLGNKWFH